MKGWGPKKFGMSFENQGNQTFWRDIPDIPRAPEKFEKKKFVFNSRPLVSLAGDVRGTCDHQVPDSTPDPNI